MGQLTGSTLYQLSQVQLQRLISIEECTHTSSVEGELSNLLCSKNGWRYRRGIVRGNVAIFLGCTTNPYAKPHVDVQGQPSVDELNKIDAIINDLEDATR